MTQLTQDRYRIMSPEHHERTSQEKKNQIPYFSLFWAFLRIGLFTLGGGLAMSVVIRHELVLKRRWIQEKNFMAEMAMATIVPGAVAVNIAYLHGYKLRGRPGAALAVLGTILPSFAIILLIAWYAFPYFSQPKVAAFFRGCAIAVGGQLAFTGLLFGRKLLRNWRRGIVCAVGLLVLSVFGAHPIWAVIAASSVGYWLCQGNKLSK